MQEFTQLVEILENYVEVEDITPESNFRADLEMSSFDTMCLVGDIKNEFGVELKAVDFVRFFMVFWYVFFEVIKMSCYIINGGKKLEGETYVSGSKNASLPILAATIISGKTTKLYNVPDIEDVKITLEILRFLGCKTDRKKHQIRRYIRTQNHKLRKSCACQL